MDSKFFAGVGLEYAGYFGTSLGNTTITPFYWYYTIDGSDPRIS